MTPNTLRIALGLLLFGAAPAAIPAFPHRAVSNTHTLQVGQPAQVQMSITEIASTALQTVFNSRR